MEQKRVLPRRREAVRYDWDLGVQPRNFFFFFSASQGQGRGSGWARESRWTGMCALSRGMCQRGGLAEYPLGDLRRPRCGGVAGMPEGEAAFTLVHTWPGRSWPGAARPYPATLPALGPHFPFSPLFQESGWSHFANLQTEA